MNRRDLFTLVLGSTGKTGSRVVADLTNRGLKIRTAARSGADVTFDWNQRDSYAPALDGIGGPIDGAIVVPTGDGAEAFIDAEDIAAVAAATLADPQTHGGKAYSLTGPEALTVAQAAAIISDEAGKPINHVDLERDAWIAGAIANGVPPEYGAVLRQLTETVANGRGSRPNGVVEKITGTPPHTFRNFAHNNANAWKEAK